MIYTNSKKENNSDIQNEVNQNILDLMKLTKQNEIKCFLSKEADSLDAYIEICRSRRN